MPALNETLFGTLKQSILQMAGILGDEFFMAFTLFDQGGHALLQPTGRQIVLQEEPDDPLDDWKQKHVLVYDLEGFMRTKPKPLYYSKLSRIDLYLRIRQPFQKD